MKKKASQISLLAILVICYLVVHVGALINQIPVGGTAYVGEQGLDIHLSVPAAGTQIGWWSIGSAFTNAPDYPMTVTDPLNFVIDPTVFGSRTGNWYVLPGKTLAFNVQDPQLAAIKVEDTTVSQDITPNGWIYRGDEARFRIESNLAEFTQRGIPGAPVTIKVQGPSGGVYSALINKQGITTPLAVDVSTTPFYTGTVWDTLNPAYAPGQYTIWAECNANRMKDNYDVVGKTESPPISILVREQNPLISVNVPTTNPTIIATTVPTKKPTTIVVTNTPISIETTTAPSLVTTQQTVQPSVTPTPTRAPGFSGMFGIIAIIVVCALYLAKRD